MQQRFLLQILLLAQNVSGTTMPIIRSPRVLYSGCCLWYFVLWFSSCWSGVELRVMCPVCRMLLLCPSSGAQEYSIVVEACGISCCGFQVVGLVWSGGLCVRFAGCCTGHIILSSTSYQELENHSTKYHRQQPLYNTLELLMMGIVVPETF